MFKGGSITKSIIEDLKSFDTENSLVDNLKDLGIDSSFVMRKIFAESVGMNEYTGKSKENIKLLKILKEGITWHKI